eukprot:1331383-Pyramimonas_sp.AAC.1
MRPREAPRWPQEAPKRPPRGLQDTPKWPSRLEEASRGPSQHPRRSETPVGQPKGPPDASRGLQTTSKSHPRRLRGAFKLGLALFRLTLLILVLPLLVPPLHPSSPSSFPILMGYDGFPRPMLR